MTERGKNAGVRTEVLLAVAFATLSITRVGLEDVSELIDGCSQFPMCL